MLRKLIVVAALAAGMSIAAITLATPALAKGPSRAHITGPGLDHAVVVSGAGEPGQQGRLATLAGQTSLFTMLFGAGGSVPAPARLFTSPPKASLGPRYILIYTVPGVTPQPGQQFGRIRQDLYPRAVGGPVIYTAPGQPGFGRPLLVTGWLRGSSQLTRTLAQLGIPPRSGTQAAPQSRIPAADQVAAHHAGSHDLAWLIASATAIAAAALASTAMWLRHRKRVAAP